MISTSSLKVGRVLHKHLEKILPCYPIIADKGASGEFCTYRRMALTPESSKDRLRNFIETALIEINICASTYSRSIELAQLVKQKLEESASQGCFATQKEEGLAITDISLSNATEDWQEDFYIQTLTFKVEMTKQKGR